MMAAFSRLFLFPDVKIENIQHLPSIPCLDPMTAIAAGAPAGISGRIPANGCIHPGSGTFGLPI
jgi:hypothetical protein